ncbi:MAG TPA: hypothetical protein VN961_23075, partial [Streptosporangiaceae bacterium]|nr:hypothetical protein [Streptosporangiaceae bacterium]
GIRNLMPDRYGLRGHDYERTTRKHAAPAAAEEGPVKEYTATCRHGDKQADDYEETPTACAGSCWSWCDGQN